MRRKLLIITSVVVAMFCVTFETSNAEAGRFRGGIRGGYRGGYVGFRGGYRAGWGGGWRGGWRPRYNAYGAYYAPRGGYYYY